VKRPPLYNAFEWSGFRHWARWLYRIELSHPERVPASGLAILVANHCIVGSEKALRPRKLKLGLPRIRLLVCEPIVVPQGRPTVAVARSLTERFEAAIEEAREPYGPPAHV
jgi:1-acyl-sn-glycerol-3-phosphate acyltransferase